MQYEPIMELLAEAIKELKTENNQLKEKLAALAGRQEALEEMFLAISTDLPKEKPGKYIEAVGWIKDEGRINP